MAERRRKNRRHERFRVNIWERGQDETARVAYTEDVSDGGVFINTPRPLKKGARVRVELLSDSQGVIIEGVVAHSKTVPIELQKIKKGGMGVRFLEASHLLTELSSSKSRAVQVQGSKEVKATTTESATGAEQSAPIPGAPIAVRFRSTKDFLRAYDRDVRMGALLVPTDDRLPVGHKVTLHIYPPAADRPFEFQARVVHHYAGADGSGLGTQFLEPSVVIETLGVFVRALRAEL
jgi:Tfp pilus assembly protein PilZ